MTDELRKFKLLIDYRDKKLNEKFYINPTSEIFNFEENKIWYKQNIEFIDKAIIKCANIILKQNGEQKRIIKVEDAYNNELLTTLYKQETIVYNKIVHSLER